ncbi:MAG: peptide chain release factor N(5)-glutamine methyltransferase [Prevotella sp.]|nr:peptide chain release factor N(5)-glutamine methyltransferase [Prevotella sp.]
MSATTYQQLWRRLTPLYEDGEAKAIVRTILEERFGLSMADILCYGTERMKADELERFEQMMVRLGKSEPVQYVLGEAAFMGRRLHVEPGVLIPRPETETLCQWVEEIWKDEAPSILDIGCGSGCIAVTLALDIPGAQVTAFDISQKALEVTRRNATAFNAGVTVVEMDILKVAEKADVKRAFDIIVSNPPYVCKHEAQEMHPNVLRYEPDIALFVPDNDPLLFYKAIARHARRALRQGGQLFFECNPDHLEDTIRMLEDEGFSDVETLEDPFGKPRFAKGSVKD